MRIMKSRKEMEHNALIADVTAQAHSRVESPGRVLVQQCCAPSRAEPRISYVNTPTATQLQQAVHSKERRSSHKQRPNPKHTTRPPPPQRSALFALHAAPAHHQEADRVAHRERVPRARQEQLSHVQVPRLTPTPAQEGEEWARGARRGSCPEPRNRWTEPRMAGRRFGAQEMLWVLRAARGCVGHPSWRAPERTAHARHPLPRLRGSELPVFYVYVCAASFIFSNDESYHPPIRSSERRKAQPESNANS